MARKTFETYTLSELKSEAADVKLGWVAVILEYLGLPGSPVPGTVQTIVKSLFGMYSGARDYYGAHVSDKISVKLGTIVALEDHVSSDKVRKLLAAQAIMLSPDLVLVDPKLKYDEIRHNYGWAGALIQVQENFGAAAEDRPTYCVIHPDENFVPVAILDSLTVRNCCTRANPNFANEMRKNISHEERTKILNARTALLKKQNK